ncbi:MAG: sigma-70 family RNA polymerase sigma factor [Clostridium sp.]|nr:sigma-70 family RNA polymerase sigma factor [Clostridium sp.]
MDENQIRQLVEEVKQGNQQSFEALYMVSCRAVYFICVSLLGNEEDAKDVVQEVYATAYEKLWQLNDGGKFVPWINHIAVNKCKKILMKKTPSFVDVEDMDSQLAEENENFLPEEYITQKEKRKLVMDIMRTSLTDIQYQTVILYYFNGLTVDEVADIMECPPGTVKYRLSVARAKIRDGVQAYENRNNDKLYSVVGVPLLMRLLYEEVNSMIIPDMLPQIMGQILTSFAGGTMSAYAAGDAVRNVAGTVAENGAGNVTGTVAENGAGNAVGTIAGNTGKGVAGGMMKAGVALKVKIAIGAVAAAVVGVGIFALVKNNKSDEAVDSGVTTEMEEQLVDTKITDTEEETDTTQAVAEFSGNWEEEEEYGYPPFWLKYADLGSYEEKDFGSLMFWDKFAFGASLEDMIMSYHYFSCKPPLEDRIETYSFDDILNYTDKKVSSGESWSVWVYEDKDVYNKCMMIDVYNMTDESLTLKECIENNQFVYVDNVGYSPFTEYNENKIREELPHVMEILGKPSKVYAIMNTTAFTDREGQQEEFADTVQMGGGTIVYSLFYDRGDYVLDLTVTEACSSMYGGSVTIRYGTKEAYDYSENTDYPLYEFE